MAWDSIVCLLKKIQNSSAAIEESNAYVEAEVDRILTSLLGLLGDPTTANTLFVPEVCGTKRPRIKGWNQLTWDTLDEYYWRCFRQSIVEEGNLAVLLGPISGDLCTIDIDRDELLADFLSVNPALRDTLTTKGNKGCQFWFRAVGLYWAEVRRILDARGNQIGEWRGGQKSTIWGEHPKSKSGKILRYRFVNETPVKEIEISTLQLPTGWRLAGRSKRDWRGGDSSNSDG